MQFSHHTIMTADQDHRSEWTNKKAVRWLDETGWSNVSRFFIENNVEHQRLLNLTYEGLKQLVHRASLSTADLLRLYNHIQSLSSDSGYSQQHQQQYSGAMASAYGRPPTQTNTNTANTQSRLNPAYPNMTNRTPQGNLEDEDYQKIRPFIPERTSSNPQQISKIVNALNYDVSQIRPFAQGRLRSNGGTAYEQHQHQHQHLSVNTNYNNNNNSGRQITNSSSGAISSNSNNGSGEATPTAASASGTGTTAAPAGVLTYDWAHMPISPRTKSTDGGWKLSGKRVHQLQEQSHSHHPSPYQQTHHQYPAQYYSQYSQQHSHPLPHKRLQRIQVTTDSQTFHSLTVTDLIDATAIKETILKKLNLESGNYLYYHENGIMYQHENGERFYAPLSDEDIVNICRKSDERPKDQISVISIAQLAPPYAVDGRGIYPDIPSNFGYNQYQRSAMPMPYPLHGEHQNPYYGHPGTPMTTDGFDPQFGNAISCSPKLIPRPVDGYPVEPDIPPSSAYGSVTPNEEYREDSGYFERNLRRSSGRSTLSQEQQHQQPIPDTYVPAMANYATPIPAELWAVRPHQQPPGDLPEPRQQKPPVSLWAVPPQKPSNVRDPSEDEVEEAKKPASLWAVPPQQDLGPWSNDADVPVKPSVAPSLWAVPPQRSSDSEGEPATPTKAPSAEPSLWAVPPQRFPDSEGDLATSKKASSSGSSLWAIPPQQQEHVQLSDPPAPTIAIETAEPEEDRIKAKQFEILSLWTRPSSDRTESTSADETGTKSGDVSLWAVPPKRISVEKENDNAANEEEKTAPVSLWAVPPKRPTLESQEAKPAADEHEKSPSSSLWAVPPKRTMSDQATVAEEDSGSSNSDHRATTSLWAIPPDRSSPSDNGQRMDQLSADNGWISDGQSASGEDGFSDTTLVSQPTLRSVPQSTPTDHSPYGELWPVDDSAPAYSRAELTSRYRLSASNEGKLKSRWRHRRQVSDARSMSGDNYEQDNSNRRTVRFGHSTSYANVEDGVEKLSLRDEPVEDRPRHKDLQIEIPYTNHDSPGRSPRTPRQKTPLSTTGSSPTSALQDPSDIEETGWGERPSVERLYRDIDKYLPGHDLDKEIFIEEANGGAALTSPAPRRLLGHKKSIRVVAKEAHSNWRQAMNVIRVNNRLRRRNTKMWGTKVEQVKPGMEIVEQTIIKDVNGTGIAPTKMQWVRGELIGRGSFGRVYHALNVAAGEWIALKEVDVPKTKSDMLNDKMKESADSLYREVSLLKDFDHENIVQYLGYDYDEEQGHIHIFLEYVPGGSILSVLTKVGKFEEVLVRYFTRQILLGLEYLHDRNVMHRDIKAGNILVDNNGICKITDFGLSKPSGQEEVYNPNANTMMKGTIFWMAPEVVKGSAYSAKIDIWSLGCTVIEMLTGSHPWLDLNMLAALYNLGKYQAPPLPEDASDLAKDFLSMCFTINPEERPTAADLLVHPFVRQEPSFNFKNYITELESKS